MSQTIDFLLGLDSPYHLCKQEKSLLLNNEMNELHVFHRKHCKQYKNITSAAQNDDIPLPVRLFKLLQLKSIPEEEVFKVLTSSGTTSQVVSKIYLDKLTAQLQTKVLAHIMKSLLGRKRLPMLIIDHPNVVKSRDSFSARGAGILGLSNFGRKHTYALDDNMNIDFEKINEFLTAHKGEEVFVFGFTFMIWQYFLTKLKEMGKNLDLSKAIVVHSGGWKKLEDQAVDNNTYKAELLRYCGIKRVHNFYGMVEQVGSIYVECNQGYLHCSNFSDVKFLDLKTMSECSIGELGVIVVRSILPRSYPGHNLLTEDIGYLIGEDDCQCGNKGKYFTVTGRLPKAELRGCSDTHDNK